MKTLGELRDDRIHLLRSCADMVEKCEKSDRTFTAEERGEFDRMQKEIVALEARIAEMDEYERRREKIKGQVDALTKQPPRRYEPGVDTILYDGSKIETGEPEERQVRLPVRPRLLQLRAFKRQGEESAYRCGMFLRAILWKDERAWRWCQNHMALEHRALSETVNTAGGALVPDEMSQVIIDLREQFGVFRRNARVLPMGSDTMKIPRTVSDIVAAFVGEGEDISESDPAFDQVGLVVKKLAARTRMSSELAEDAVIDLAELVATQLARAFALKEDQCGFNGTGAQTFAGIVGVTEKIIDGTHTAGVVEAAATHDLFSEIDNVDITKLMGALPEYAAGNAVFFASRRAAAEVFGRLQATAGGNTIQTLEGVPMMTYLGHPIVISQVLPKVDAGGVLNDKVMLLFGDLSLAATLGERRGFSVSTSDQRYWELDQIAIKATERIDINVHDLGDTTDAGPIVALIGTT